MASTYSPADAIAIAQNFAHGIPVDAVSANVCDIVNSMIWVFYPWPWSIATLTAITLSDGVQDYAPSSADLAAILRPLQLRIARTDITPNEFRELDILGQMGVELSRKGGLETVKAVGWLAATGVFRFDVAISVGTGQTLQLQGLYQKKPTKITDATLSTVFAFPDQYFNAFVEGMKWKIYQLSDDPRAGQLQWDNHGNRHYTGQIGVFVTELERMSRTEDLGTGDQFRFPENPLGVGRSYWPGLYGI